MLACVSCGGSEPANGRSSVDGGLLHELVRDVGWRRLPAPSTGEIVAAFEPWRTNAAAHAAVDAAHAACRCARYYWAQAVTPGDSRVVHPNPFRLLLEYHLAGGVWRDVVTAWRSR